MHAPVPKSQAAKRTLPTSAMTVFSFLAAVLLAASSAAPTPLYPLYQQSLHLSPLMITTVFAVYAFSLLVALLTVGSLSDHIGRKPVIVASLLLNVGAMLLFVRTNDLAHLLFARAVQGLSVGTGITVLGAAILDTNKRHGPLLNSVFIFLGLTVGALGSGLLVAFAPNPMHLIFEVLLAVTAVLFVALWAMPETTAGKAGAWASLRPHVAVPVQSRAALLRLTPGNVAVWAFGAFYLALMPAIVATAMHASSALTGGVVVATLMATAAMTVAGARSLKPRLLVQVGTVMLSLGAAISLFGIEQQAVGALFAGTIVAGVGFGASFSGSLQSLLPTAHADQRAGLLSAFYVQCYLAFSLPAIAAGLAIPRIGLANTAYIYGGGVIVLALISMVAALFGGDTTHTRTDR
ncbi:MFS transporter [Rhodoplanes sp. Z2-YC6860]|uniref:MFS transporter n=1 Tax=Rhodoplanes sp. Z2-YC6860 TaxID=674703 RepID=UPI00078B44F3|nr:MFS transporter [Rhodoplanes sp. Z2-YC6860]AMN42647.1 major facilitator transporter [Rhodoplanes sp. Z2-YC6860]